MATEIYYHPNIMRKREARFVKELIKRVKPDKIIHSNFILPAYLLLESVETTEIIHWVKHSALTHKRRNSAVQELNLCPSTIKVAIHPNQISCDVVIHNNGKAHYIEFHEDQHARLTVKRPAVIYTQNGEPLTVPRYIQRLVRDVWRVKYLRPYSVIWADWFEQNGLDSFNCHASAYQEYVLPQRCNFKELGI